MLIKQNTPGGTCALLTAWGRDRYPHQHADPDQGGGANRQYCGAAVGTAERSTKAVVRFALVVAGHRVGWNRIPQTAPQESWALCDFGCLRSADAELPSLRWRRIFAAATATKRYTNRDLRGDVTGTSGGTQPTVITVGFTVTIGR